MRICQFWSRERVSIQIRNYIDFWLVNFADRKRVFVYDFHSIIGLIENVSIWSHVSIGDTKGIDFYWDFQSQRKVYDVSRIAPNYLESRERELRQKWKKKNVQYKEAALFLNLQQHFLKKISSATTCTIVLINYYTIFSFLLSQLWLLIFYYANWNVLQNEKGDVLWLNLRISWNKSQL